MESDEEASKALIEEKTTNIYTSKRRSKYELVLPWSLAAIFFCWTLFFALRNSLAVQVPAIARSSSYELGFITDLLATKPPIPLKIVRKKFTNDLLFNASSQSLYNQPLDPNEVTYIGEPSAAINDAWHNLLHAQYVSVEPEETSPIPPSHISPIWYHGMHNFLELSVFHNLHCLNEIRLALDGKKHTHGKRDWMHEGRAHLDHCVDQIRQALMCHSDLTPVPMNPVKGGTAGSFVGNGEEHTCRDFDAIWAWVEERGSKSKALGD